MKTTIEIIAKKCLQINTLNTRGSDGLDFHDCAVWGIRSALEEVYLAGNKAAHDKSTKDFYDTLIKGQSS